MAGNEHAWGSPCFCRVFSTLAGLPTPASAAAEPSLPHHWEHINSKRGNKHLVQLTKEKHADELAEVEQHWQQTDGDGTIVAVHRIQNSALHHRFEGARQSTPGLVEQIAYHGTSANVPALIYDSPKGFDMSRGMAQPGYLWFAQHAQYSSSSYYHPLGSRSCWLATGPRKQILRVRLLLDSEQLEGWENEVVIVRQSERCLPEYLITFQ